jgi:hypothetical protein
MQANMSAGDVLSQISRLKSDGQSLNKKKIKHSHPELMQNALYYFPSWEHAIQNADSL